MRPAGRHSGYLRLGRQSSRTGGPPLLFGHPRLSALDAHRREHLGRRGPFPGHLSYGRGRSLAHSVEVVQLLPSPLRFAATASMASADIGRRDRFACVTFASLFGDPRCKDRSTLFRADLSTALLPADRAIHPSNVHGGSDEDCGAGVSWGVSAARDGLSPPTMPASQSRPAAPVLEPQRRRITLHYLSSVWCITRRFFSSSSLTIVAFRSLETATCSSITFVKYRLASW